MERHDLTRRAFYRYFDGHQEPYIGGPTPLSELLDWAGEPESEEHLAEFVSGKSPIGDYRVVPLEELKGEFRDLRNKLASVLEDDDVV